MTHAAAPVPFRVSFPDTALADLATRLRATRWLRGTVQPGWAGGVDHEYLRHLLQRWQEGFDWASRQEILNRYPQFLADIDGRKVHFLHGRGRGHAPFPLLLTHGWPSTCWEFLPLVELLTASPDGADTFDLVIPSLPGYTFSDPVPHAASIPALWHRLMSGVLGYQRYGAHGGDVGAMVTNRLAIEHPDAVAGIHVTMPAEPAVDPASLTGERSGPTSNSGRIRARRAAYTRTCSGPGPTRSPSR